jgi:predicted transcriptional regulator
MITALKQMLPQIEAWSERDQEALAEAAREIAAGREAQYRASASELEGIDKGLEDASNGRFASTETVEAIRAKFRAV